MIETILHFKQIEVATFRLTCGSKNGTAFAVQTEKNEQFLLTAEHNLIDSENEQIIIEINEKSFPASIVDRIRDKDVALIKIAKQNITGLPLAANEIPYNEQWETFGFTSERIFSGGRYNGTVSRINDDTKWDIDLDCRQYVNLTSFAGLSGAPLVVAGKVMGVIGYDLSGSLGATSIKSIFEILSGAGVAVKEETKGDIPASIESDISDSTKNSEVFHDIDNTIDLENHSNYFLLSGSPGSGKTSIAAKFEFSSEQNIIIDRYFVKVPKDDKIPTDIRATPDYFMNWLEEVYHRILFNHPPTKSDKSLNERLLAINDALRSMSKNYSSRGQTGFLIIDGLDDVKQQHIENFLSPIPLNLPSNIKVIFSCTSKIALPQKISLLISENQEIKVTPLTEHKTKNFLKEKLEGKSLTNPQIEKLAHKSEGHPLYLRYLTQYIIESHDVSDIDNWIDSIPSIGGQIDIYYKSIWNQFDGKNDEIWIASTLSRVRLPVEKEILYELVPKSSQLSFIETLKKIDHLLKNDDKLAIYHTSFSDFINSKTEIYEKDINDNIASYCISKTQTYFSISEKIYHLSKGSETNRITAIDQCNQNWIDKCALYSVNPDIVLSDIQRMIGIAAEYGIAYKVIALLLLSQRVNFRYNILFEENATYLVNALLALKKPEEALRYVIRNNSLTVSDADALYLLQKFFEYGNNEEAKILLTAIKKTSDNLLENGFDSETFNRFITLKLTASTLSSNLNFEESFYEFQHFKDAIEKEIRRNGNSEEKIFRYKDEVGSNHSGYYIWRHNFPPSTKWLEENTEFIFDNKYSGFTALSILQAENYKKKSPIKNLRGSINEWVSDLEYIIEKYGVHADYRSYILRVLLENSNRVDLTEKLISETFADRVNLELRSKNGVDLNHSAIHTFTLYAESNGYTDSKDQYPVIEDIVYSSWEKYIKTLYEYLWFLSGKAIRLKAEHKSHEIEGLKTHLNAFIEKLNFPLKYRIHWERSYRIPENSIPVIYNKLITFLIDYFPNEINEFIKPITDKKNYQLGIYNEGYIDSLFIIARNLSQNENQIISAHKVSAVLEEFIIKSIENRWERNEYLLRLIEIYAQMENEKKAYQIFEEMIATSMGPSWYKEAQLGIINTTVSKIVPKNGTFAYLKEFAAHLYHASGEMTFQRYVKQQQEQFIGDLAKVGFLNQSVEYFKNHILPDYSTILKNAESSPIDMPIPGTAYNLGARSIEEQSGVLELLSGINCRSSIFAWALTELFLPGDNRYLNNFANIQCSIIENADKETTEKAEKILERLNRFIVAEVDPEYKTEYLNYLNDGISKKNLEKLNSCKTSFKNKQSVARKKEANETDNSFDAPLKKLADINEQVKIKLEIGNKSASRKLIVESLSEIQKENYSVWSRNYSTKINGLIDLLTYSYDTSEELIKDIKPLLINEPYYEEWVIADKLIELLQNVTNEEEQEKILSVVMEHIELMVRTPQQTIADFSWLEKSQKSSEKETDDILLDFIIWFLNHPELIIKNRTVEILVWLSTIEPERVITALVKELLTEGYKLSKELSAAVLHQVADLNADLFWQQFKICLEEHKQEILAVKHFMIRNSIMESLEIVHNRGIKDAVIWQDEFKKQFCIAKSDNGEVILEEDYLDPIEDYIFALNELGILNEDFCESFIEQVKFYCPLTIEDTIRTNEYIDRSFNNFNDITIISDFENILRFCLNISVTNCVSLDLRKKVASVLRCYQPTFPENNLKIKENNYEDINNCIKNIFENKIPSINGLFNNEKEIYLHYLYNETSKDNLPSSRYHLTAYLVDCNAKIEDLLFPWIQFPSNDYPDYETQSDTDNVTSLIIRSSYEIAVGSDLVPSQIADNISQSFSSNAIKDIKCLYWREGRNWDKINNGQPLKIGYNITIPEKHLKDISEKLKLVWLINHGYRRVMIDVSEKKIIEI